MARPSGQPAMEVTALDLVPSLRYTTWVSSRLAVGGSGALQRRSLRSEPRPEPEMNQVVARGGGGGGGGGGAFVRPWRLR